jgi:hypothetical protein
MSGPRHLWSGDWRLESSAHAEDLAARRARPEARAENEPEVEPRRRARSAARARFAAQAVRAVHAAWAWVQRVGRGVAGRIRALRRRGARRIRAALLVAGLVVLSAGAAYVVTSLVVRAVDGSLGVIAPTQVVLGTHPAGHR